MNMLIDEKDLKLLVETKRDFIGSKPASWDAVLSGGAFALSSLAAEYKQIGIMPGEILKTVCVLLGIFFAALGLYKVIESKKRKNQYSKDDFLSDIKNIDQIEHPHSLVAIKDTFNDYPSRYLLYHDDKWGCDFFFNYKTDGINDEASVKARLSSALKIPSEQIIIQYVGERVYTKYSVRENRNKCYAHKLYSASISDFPVQIKQSQFTVDGISYKWMNINEMEHDPDIQQKNMDVVNMVKEMII